MRISRKTNSCLNCGRTLGEIYNYCPNCGQGNHDDNVSFKTLVGDFFNTYLAIDSKFGKTIKPFFIKPGYLTNQYVIGKRVSYAHPIRLYLIISIFYFFTFTIATKHLALGDENNGKAPIRTSNDMSLLDDVEDLPDSTKFQIIRTLNGNERSILKKEVKNRNKEELEELNSFFTSLDTATQFKLRASIGDSIADELSLVDKSTFKKDTSKLAEIKKEIKEESEDSWLIVDDIDFKKIKSLDKEYDEEISNEQIYDSLKLGELGYFQRLQAKQAIRVQRANQEQIVGYIVKNLPLMMLILIPIFALILKLLYIRRKELYIKHLVHALHLHSFAYFLYGVFIILTIYIVQNEDIGSILNIIAFFIVSAYAFISFLRVYGQHWFKTFIKFNVVGIVYCAAIFVFFLMEMLISLMLF